VPWAREPPRATARTAGRAAGRSPTWSRKLWSVMRSPIAGSGWRGGADATGRTPERGADGVLGDRCVGGFLTSRRGLHRLSGTGCRGPMVAPWGWALPYGSDVAVRVRPGGTALSVRGWVVRDRQRAPACRFSASRKRHAGPRRRASESAGCATGQVGSCSARRPVACVEAVEAPVSTALAGHCPARHPSWRPRVPRWSPARGAPRSRGGPRPRLQPRPGAPSTSANSGTGRMWRR
jgi:hypothetical protein